MHWIAPIEKDATDQFRADSSAILGLIFLRNNSGYNKNALHADAVDFWRIRHAA